MVYKKPPGRNRHSELALGMKIVRPLAEPVMIVTLSVLMTMGIDSVLGLSIPFGTIAGAATGSFLVLYVANFYRLN